MTSDSLPGVLIASGHWDAEPWARPFRADPRRPLAIWPDLPDPSAIEYLLAWRLPADLLGALPNLRIVFSLGAGVDHIFKSGVIPTVPIVRIVDPDLTGRMVEWVVLQVLLHHRQHFAYAKQQRDHVWHERDQPAATAVRVGIMGLGNLGRAAADALGRLGFDVAGWSRTPQEVAGIETFAGPAGLTPFLNRTDILVALLPLTPDTRGILDLALFERLAKDGALGGPVLINGGRGGLQIGADILKALDDNLLIGASLDVFEPEPLPADSRFWDHPKVFLTPHAAASSEGDVLAAGLLQQILDFEAGRPLRNVVDFSRGY